MVQVSQYGRSKLKHRRAWAELRRNDYSSWLFRFLILSYPLSSMFCFLLSHWSNLAGNQNSTNERAGIEIYLKMDKPEYKRKDRNMNKTRKQKKQNRLYRATLHLLQKANMELKKLIPKSLGHAQL